MTIHAGLNAPTYVPDVTWRSVNSSPQTVVRHAPGTQAVVSVAALRPPMHEPPPPTTICELKDVPAGHRHELLATMADAFHDQWWIQDQVDDRYKTPPSARAELERRMQSTDPHELVLVSHVEGKLVCTASMSRRDNPAFDHEYTDQDGRARRKYDDGWLVDVYTVPESRRKGHAGKMIGKVFEAAKARGLPTMHLYTEERLVPYYLKAGFGVVGRDYVPEGRGTPQQSCEVVMRCPPPRLWKLEDPDRAPIQVKDPEAFARRVQQALPLLPFDRVDNAVA